MDTLELNMVLFVKPVYRNPVGVDRLVVKLITHHSSFTIHVGMTTKDFCQVLPPPRNNSLNSPTRDDKSHFHSQGSGLSWRSQIKDAACDV